MLENRTIGIRNQGVGVVNEGFSGLVGSGMSLPEREVAVEGRNCVGHWRILRHAGHLRHRSHLRNLKHLGNASHLGH